MENKVSFGGCCEKYILGTICFIKVTWFSNLLNLSNHCEIIFLRCIEIHRFTSEMHTFHMATKTLIGSLSDSLRGYERTIYGRLTG